MMHHRTRLLLVIWFVPGQRVTSVQALIGAVSGVQIACPDDDPCVGCSSTFNEWQCITIPAGAHNPPLSVEEKMVEAGIKGLKHIRKMRYGVNIHKSAATYPCGNSSALCSDENKLFGASRGLTQVMHESCMFGWRAAYKPDEPKGKVLMYGYGWYNKSLPPWRTPGQNPVMGFYDHSTDYIFGIDFQESLCNYTISLPNGTLLAHATTKQKSFTAGPSYFFNFFFGGSATATVPTTISFSKLDIS